MKELSIVVLNVDGRADVSGLLHSLEGLPVKYELVVVHTRKEHADTSDHLFKQYVLRNTKKLTADFQKVIARCHYEWILFLESTETVASFFEPKRIPANAECFRVTVSRTSGKLTTITDEVRLFKKTSVHRLYSTDAKVKHCGLRVSGTLLNQTVTHSKTVDHAYIRLLEALLPDKSIEEQTHLDVKKAIYFFAMQDYLIASNTFLFVLNHAKNDRYIKRLCQYYAVLCYINLGMAAECLEFVLDVINEDDDYGKKDFCILFAKLAIASKNSDIKKEALDLLKDCYLTLKEDPLLFTHTCHYEMFYYAAQLAKQLGNGQQANKLLWESLLFSNYQYPLPAYEIVDQIRETSQEADAEQLAKEIIGQFYAANPDATKPLLYPLLNYANLEQWAALYYAEHAGAVHRGTNELVSIILPVYNQRMYLGASIESVLDQTHRNLELIIIDDGSTDNVQEIVDNYSYDQRVRYVRLDQNSGLPYSLNTGLGLAAGGYITWTSADNLMHRDMIETLLAAFGDRSDIVAAYSDYQFIDENGLIVEYKRNKPYELNGMSNLGPSFLWRADAVEQTGQFDLNLAGIEDRDYSVRIALSGETVLVPEILYSYRVHSDSLSHKIQHGDMGGWEALHEALQKKWLFLNFV